MRSVSVEDRLDQAMHVFWERGYWDTSIDQLIDRTGLHRAEVYGKFGSKRGLFEATLRRYRETVIAVFLEPLGRPNAALTDIARFFVGIHDGAVEPERRLGCLMINTASEVSPHVRSVARIISEYLDELGGLLCRACVNATKRRELPSNTDVDQVADYLVGSVFGLWVLARSPAPDTVLRHYVEGVLASLDAWDPKRSNVRLGERALGKPRGAHR
jgi:TetR/AcrR family transcriptional regulator, transcriptional repressor for nem operon